MYTLSWFSFPIDPLTWRHMGVMLSEITDSSTEPVYNPEWRRDTNPHHIIIGDLT